MQIVWLEEAVKDLTDIRAYIAHEHPNTAASVAQRIVETISYLRDHPGIGRPGRIPGTRELIIPGLPYFVPYRVKSNVIELLGVLHSARQWPNEEHSTS